MIFNWRTWEGTCEYTGRAYDAHTGEELVLVYCDTKTHEIERNLTQEGCDLSKDIIDYKDYLRYEDGEIITSKEFRQVRLEWFPGKGPVNCEECDSWGETAQPSDMDFIRCGNCHRRVVSPDAGRVNEVAEQNNYDPPSSDQTAFERAWSKMVAGTKFDWPHLNKIPPYTPEDDYPEPDHVT